MGISKLLSVGIWVHKIGNFVKNTILIFVSLADGFDSMKNISAVFIYLHNGDGNDYECHLVQPRNMHTHVVFLRPTKASRAGQDLYEHFLKQDERAQQNSGHHRSRKGNELHGQTHRSFSHRGRPHFRSPSRLLKLNTIKRRKGRRPSKERKQASEKNMHMSSSREEFEQEMHAEFQAEFHVKLKEECFRLDVRQQEESLLVSWRLWSCALIVESWRLSRTPT